MKLTTLIYISSAEVKNVWHHTATPPACLSGLPADSFTSTVGSLPYSPDPTPGSYIIDQSSPIHTTLHRLLSSPVTDLEWPGGFQEVKVPRFHDNGTGRW